MAWRYRLSLFLVISAYLIIVCRLFYWQVVKSEELTAWAESQYGQYVKLVPQRGEIKSSDGYPIAANTISYLAYANPKEIPRKDQGKVVTMLSSSLDLDSSSISAQLTLDRFWVPLKDEITHETKEKIQKLELPGIGFEDRFTRFYPEGSMAAQLVGFVGKDDSGENKGYFGLEGFYDRQLKGKSGIAVQIRDAFGRPVLAKMKERNGKIDGRNLALGIDRAIQYTVEEKLKDGVEKYEASGGMVGIMDPRSGTILAMASYPSFDPREYSEFESEVYKNPFISNVFEPGSTFKSLVMAAALDSKVVKPETKCPICDGPISIGGYEIKTWNNKYIKDISMLETIQHSDNTGMVYVSQKLGLERMISYLKKFGIGDITGIDLQGEVAPSLRENDNWYPIDVATTSFGQGISVTPIELLTAFASIANEGIRMEPHVVSKIITADGETIPIKPKAVDRPISSVTAKVMTEFLVNAVDKGEAKWAKPKGYRIAGKTGTAQIPISGHYDPNKTIASFIGFAPANDPKFAMLVVIDRPTTSIYGSETAAPIFFSIAKDVLSYYGISPTEPQ